MAQRVQGFLVDRTTGEPVGGALVLLLDSLGQEQGGYLTDGAGRFLIRAPSPGIYTLRAERLGYETSESGVLRLGTSRQMGIRLETAPTAIELEGITVEGSQRCLVRPAQGRRTASVWEEARKALAAQSWTDRSGLFRFQMARYRRRLDAGARMVRSEDRSVISGISRSPIRSLPAQELMEAGFIQPNDEGGYNYYGPDAAVLLSDHFLDTHCFTLQTNPEGREWVGLSFEPVNRSILPDIQGTLWLDAETAALKVLEYSYTWSPWPEARGVANGRVEFELLPGGAWIVRRWWIRMPEMGRTAPVPSMRMESEVRLTGILEVGGEILRHTSLHQAVTRELARGVLEGQVWDSTRNVPLEGANVFLNGTSFSTRSGEDGGFVIHELPEGVFSATFTHPRLDSLASFSPARDVAVQPGEATSITLGVPPRQAQPSSACPGKALGSRQTAIIGQARDESTGRSAEGAEVVASWSTFDNPAPGEIRERFHELRTEVGSDGRFTLCGIPLDTSVQVLIVKGDRISEPSVLEGRPGALTFLKLILPAGAF